MSVKQTKLKGDERMLSDEQIDKELREAIQKEAQREVKKKKAIIFYVLGFTTATITFLIINLFK